MEDRSVHEVLLEIAHLLKPVAGLSLEIVTQAELQKYSEDLYNQLVELAYEGMGFLEETQPGQVISAAWIVHRDSIVSRARRLILDAPNVPEDQR